MGKYSVRRGINEAVEHLDVTVAIVGCFISALITIYIQIALNQPAYVVIGAISFLSFISYLFLRRRVTEPSISRNEINIRSYILLNILFTSIFACSIIVIYLRGDLYTRPLPYFILTAAMVAIVAIEALLSPQRFFALTLIKIILIGLSVQWSQSLIFPEVVGIDPWYHQWFTLRILEHGEILSGPGKYSATPAFHLMIGTNSIISGLNYKLSTMFSIGFTQVLCNAFFIFLLGKYVHSVKAGLLAALFLMSATFFIRYSFWTIPYTMSVIFIPITVYLLLKLRQYRVKTSVGLAILLMTTVLLTHPIGTVCLGATLFLFWVGSEIYKRLRYKTPMPNKAFLLIAIIFTVTALGWWSFGSGHIRNLVNITGFDITNIMDYPTPFTTSANNKSPSLPAPALISPGNEEIIAGEFVIFQWEAIPDAYNYRLEVNSNPNWEQDGRHFLGMVGNTTQYRDTCFTDNGTKFYWRVWAISDQGWSSNRSVLNESHNFLNGTDKSLHTTPVSSQIDSLDQASAHYAANVPLAERLFHDLGFFLFFAFGVIGSLVMLRKYERTSLRFIYAFVALIILMAALVGLIINIFPGRLLYFAHIILAIPVGIAIMYLETLTRKTAFNCFIICCLAFSLAFLMIISPRANLENRTLSPNTGIRYALTSSELTASDTVATLWYGQFASDWYTGRIKYMPNKYIFVRDISSTLVNGNYDDCQCMPILIRREITQQPFHLKGGGTYKLNYDPYQALTDDRYWHVYNCGSSSAFIR